MKKEFLKPIAVANGDGGTGRVLPIVLDTVFADFPFHMIDVSVPNRIATGDKCIVEAVEAFLQYGSGFKNSTASNDPEMIKLGWKSVNIRMRPMLGTYAMLRMLQGLGGRYEQICGVLRYGHGSFYNEISCKEEIIEGARTAVVTQYLNLDDLRPFALLAIEQAQKHNLHLIVASKSTIAKSEAYFRSEIEKVWKEQGLVDGVDFHHELTDIGIAMLPVLTAKGTNKGGFLFVANNADGDTASDVVDIQNGKNMMGSTVYCSKDGKIFTFEELPSGTANEKATGDLSGDNFFNPAAMILQLAAAYEKVNPEQSEFFAQVRTETLAYLDDPEYKKDTEYMLDAIRARVKKFIVAPVTE